MLLKMWGELQLCVCERQLQRIIQKEKITKEGEIKMFKPFNNVL